MPVEQRGTDNAVGHCAGCRPEEVSDLDTTAMLSQVIFLTAMTVFRCAVP